MKTCNKCHKEQLLSNYYKDRRLLDGHRAICKTCNRGRDRREYYRQYKLKKLAERIASGEYTPPVPKPKKPTRGKRIVDLAMKLEKQKRLKLIMERWKFIKNTHTPKQSNQPPRILQLGTQQQETEVRQTSEIPLGINP